MESGLIQKRLVAVHVVLVEGNSQRKLHLEGTKEQE